jgi:ligand-binding sensor domain-containing protein
MTGDPRGARAWVYGTRESGEADLVGVEYGMASQTGGVDPPAAVLGGAGAPTVARPELAAGTDGRVWLAGDTLGGSRVYVFDGKAFSDVTPADDLLKGRRFTQLLMSKTGDLYAATDGVGVLVYDGKAWREHPVNADLPTLEGTEIKPVSCIDLDPNLGYLWVGMDNNVICWRPDQQR